MQKQQNSTDDYIRCVNHCSDKFPNEPARSTCIAGCAKNNSQSTIFEYLADITSTEVKQQLARLSKKRQ